MSSVTETGTSLQSWAAPKLVHVRASWCSSGTRFTSSKPIPSSTNSKSFQSTPPEWGVPSRIPRRVSISAMHFGPMLRTASRSSVLIQSFPPPGRPSNNPSRLSRTMGELEPLTHAFANMSPVAQSSKISSSNKAKSYSKRSSKVYPLQSTSNVSCRPSVFIGSESSLRDVLIAGPITLEIIRKTSVRGVR